MYVDDWHQRHVFVLHEHLQHYFTYFKIAISHWKDSWFSFPCVMVIDLLSTYHGMFPEAQQDEQWQGLVNSLYRNIACSDTRLFPVFNRVSACIHASLTILLFSICAFIVYMLYLNSFEFDVLSPLQCTCVSLFILERSCFFAGINLLRIAQLSLRCCDALGLIY